MEITIMFQQSEFLVFLVFYPVNLDLVINELVHVGDHGAALDVHQDEAGDDLSLKGRVSYCCGARVDIKLVLNASILFVCPILN